APPDPLGQPDAWFGLYDKAAVFDHRERRVVLTSTGLGAADEKEREARAAAGLRDLSEALGNASTTPRPAASAAGRLSRAASLQTDKAAYLRSIARALDYIAAGDLYQVNLSHRIACPFAGDPVGLFLDLARHNPAPFSAYLDAGDFQVASASPERFLSL